MRRNICRFLAWLLWKFSPRITKMDSHPSDMVVVGKILCIPDERPISINACVIYNFVEGPAIEVVNTSQLAKEKMSV
jgi:hypothetical protein